MKNKIKIMALAAASVLVFSCSKSSEVAAVVTPPVSTAYNVTGVLNNANEILTSGSLTGTFDSATKVLTVSVTHNMPAGKAIAGHLHLGGITMSGGVILPFTGSLDSPIAAQMVTLNDAQVTALKAGGIYVNLHSAAFPNGEIRGQLAVDATSPVAKVTATLSANTVDNSKATGTVTGAYDSSTKAFSITVTYKDLVAVPVTPATTPPTTTPGVAILGHIHAGLAGFSGNPVFTFDPTKLASPITFTATLTADQEKALLATGYYVNIHTATYMGGEIRGQLLATKK